MSRILVRLAIVTMAATGLAGCIQPLYGPGMTQVSTRFAEIEVVQIEGHLGHQIKSELDFVLNNGKPPERPKYRLTIKPTGSSAGIVADSATGRPQVMSYSVQANYQLVSINDGASISTGTATAVASYDRSQQRFATVRALRDAEIRTARDLAEQIRARLVPGLSGMRG